MRSKGISRLAAILLVCLSGGVCARALEFSASTYPVGTGPVASVAADFNGDGKADLAVANSGSNNISILLNNGDGTFQAAVNYAVGTSPVALAAGDFDGDGKQDLLVVNQGSVTNHINGNLSFLKGKGDGTFQPPASILVGVNPNSLAVADFNADKKLDLIIGDASSTAVSILLGNGDGTFKTPVAVTTGGITTSLVSADFNADSKADVAVAVKGATSVVLLGKGDGTFQSPTSIAVGVGLIAAGDFNSDQKIDLISRVHTPPSPGCRFICGSDVTNVYLGNGDGTFQAAVRVVSFFGTGTGNVALADFNLDGKLDISHGRFASVSFYLGKNDGTFLNMQAVTVGNEAHFMTAADLNNDKKADLVTTNQSQNTVTVLLNQSPMSGADVGITMAVDLDPALATQNLTYTMNLSNTGPQDATNVTVTDALPTSMDFVSASPSQGSCSGTTTVTCNFGAMPSPSKATFNLVVIPTQAGSITNTANLAATEPDLAAANNSASVTSTVLLPADLVLTKTPSATSVPVGANITYTLFVTNKGPASATNVVLTDTPSNNFPIVSIATTQGSCTPDSATGNITCNLGSMAVNASTTVTVVVTANAAATATNNAGVSADQPTLSNSFASATVLVGAADLVIAQTAPPTAVTTGANVTFAITIINKGPFSATNVQLSDALPQNGIVSITPSQGSCGAPANLQVNCSLGSMASGATVTVNLVMAPAAGGLFTNQVNVFSDSPDIVPDDNSASTSVTVNPAPDFSFSAASTTLVGHPGGSVTDVLTFASLNGFSSTIALTCAVSGPPPLPDCDVSPNSIAANTNMPTATLTVRIPISTTMLVQPPFHAHVRPVSGLALLCVFCVVALGAGCIRSRRWRLLLSGGVAAAILLLCGCGSSNSTPPPKTYTVTVTATTTSPSGPMSHSIPVGLTVQ